jgi:hypothetical protein
MPSCELEARVSGGRDFVAPATVSDSPEAVSAGVVRCPSMTTADGHPRSTSYSRRIGDYVRPPSSLRLDGTLSYYAKTGHENEHVLHALPTGVEIDVDIVQEPRNPHNNNALEHDVNETRIY